MYNYSFMMMPTKSGIKSSNNINNNIYQLINSDAESEQILLKVAARSQQLQPLRQSSAFSVPALKNIDTFAIFLSGWARRSYFH